MRHLHTLFLLRPTDFCFQRICFSVKVFRSKDGLRNPERAFKKILDYIIKTFTIIDVLTSIYL
jgi:L-lysine 2,3-aminomutase